MTYTLGLTGMSRQTEDAVRNAFEIAKSQLGGAWAWAAADSADYVIVDMDSVYGPASFMQLHSAGKRVIALTDGSRTQAEFLLDRGNLTAGLGTLLKDIARGPTDAATAAATRIDEEEIPTLDSAVSLPFDPEEAPIIPPVKRVEPVVTRPPTTFSPAPAPTDQLPDVRTLHPVQEPVVTPVGQTAAPALAEMPAPPPAAARADRPLHDWLQSNALFGKRLLQGSDGTSVLIDVESGTWLGSNALKPLAEAYGGTFLESDFKLADAQAVEAHTALFGTPQPLARLQWASGLGCGKGQLLPGYSRETEFKLVKWPQTEREFPKHFRIATAMMKGPGTIAQIATAANVTDPEVADFINANLVTGFAEAVGAAAAPVSDPSSGGGGLLGRFRR